MHVDNIMTFHSEDVALEHHGRGTIVADMARLLIYQDKRCSHSFRTDSQEHQGRHYSKDTGSKENKITFSISYTISSSIFACWA
jgi:hypothetical protein